MPPSPDLHQVPPPRPPAGARAAARVPTPPGAPHVAGTAPASGPPQVNRPGWTIEPGWSAYPNGVPPVAPEQPPSFDEPFAPGRAAANPGVRAAEDLENTSSLAGALLGTGTGPAQPEPAGNGRRTALIVAIVLIVAVAAGAGIAMLAGDTIMSLLDNVLA